MIVGLFIKLKSFAKLDDSLRLWRRADRGQDDAKRS